MGRTDFVKIYDRQKSKNSPPEIYPDFDPRKSQDLMVRGGTFYAIWNERKGLWSTEIDDVINEIDAEMERYKAEHPDLSQAKILYMRRSSSGSMKAFWQYVKQLTLDNFHPLDENLTFLNTPTNKQDYASKRLPYALEAGSYEAWDELVGTLYSPEERHKIEWAIGSVVNGASKELQKFFVFYGDSGTGKSTILNIIEDLFSCDKNGNGYCGKFKAKALGSSNQNFALESFKDNPLVAIQHDGDLSRIDDNTTLNSVVSHEPMPINAKYDREFVMRIHSLLFMGTNKPVKITDSKSGVIRRLVDISPTGNLIPKKRYNQLMKAIEFEHGAIAWHCKEVFEADPYYYDDYIPRTMIGATNDFYNFMEEYYDKFTKDGGTTLFTAWNLYKTYCEDAKVPYPYSKKVFKEELKNYFSIYKDRGYFNGSQTRSIYENLKIEKFTDGSVGSDPSQIESRSWLQFNTTESLLDKMGKDWPASYAYVKPNGDDQPSKAWDKCDTVLADLNTSELHYTRPPEEIRNKLVRIDFDGKDPVTGEKSLAINMEAASKWPETYAEISRSGGGIHLYYFYTGDINMLASRIDENTELKVLTGLSSIRRKLTRCNDIPIATISSGLPLRKEKRKVINEYTIENQKHLVAAIRKALRKEIEPYSTTCCVDYIGKVLQDALDAGIEFDVSDMKPEILAFALSSTHNAISCVDKASNFQYSSNKKAEWIEPPKMGEEKTIAFFDSEVFPNLFVFCYKPLGKECIPMINPTGHELIDIFQTYNMIGFNNLGYDNTICYLRMQGASNFELFERSQNIINSNKKKKDDEGETFNRYVDYNARNLSYTDVYDYCSEKKSLKKWEIALQKKGVPIRHDEAGLPWDKPVPKDKWKRVAEYCCNDVNATEQVFLATQSDFKAREILVDLANALRGPGSTVNDMTNTLTAKLIVGKEKHPQGLFNYPNLSEEFPGYEFSQYGFPKEKFMLPVTDIPNGNPLLNGFFEMDINGEYVKTKDEEILFGKQYYRNTKIKGFSFYKGYDPGEGGFVYERPGIYYGADCYDSASHHPSTIIAKNGFGPYTENFKTLLDIRLHIKHKDYDWVRSLYGGILAPYLTSDEDAKQLSQALKIAINSVYGLTGAKFPNKLRDPRNVDNWVAKRGALFMIDLMLKVQEMGYTVIHVKTDSIKIDKPDEKIFQFVYDYGKKFGYTFEVEHKFDRLCLVNRAVYICKYKDDPANGKDAGKWEGTGAQFKKETSPYVFKTLFSHEPVDFYDLCVTQTVSTGGGLYLDMDEDLQDSEPMEKERDRLVAKWKKVGFELNAQNDADLVNRFAPNLTGISDKRIEQFAQAAYHEDYVRLCKLEEDIRRCHDYRFIGKAGLFCPIVDGVGAGRLVRENNGNFGYAAGAKGYRWLEAETVKDLGLEDKIDMSYFNAQVQEAIDAINTFGDFNTFVAEN